MYVGGFKNVVLQAMSPEIIERLALRPMIFPVKHDFEAPGRAIQRLYFIESGMASATATFADGSEVEVGTFGYESAVGMSGLIGSLRSLNGSVAKFRWSREDGLNTSGAGHVRVQVASL